MLNLISIQFLKREIDRFEQDRSLQYDNPLYYSLAKKELMLLEKIEAEYSDFTGDIQEMERRLKKKKIFLLDPEDVSEMKRKSEKYETIKKFVEED